MGNYRYRYSGEKCENCNEGHIEQTVIPRSTGSVLVSGLMGFFVADDFFNDSERYLRCNKCNIRFATKVWDENLEADKPMTLKDFFLNLVAVAALVMFVLIMYVLFALGSWLIGKALG